MSLGQKFRWMKRSFQLLLILNIFMVTWGLVAFAKYVQVHEPTALELGFVGISTFFFGIVLPAIIISRIQSVGREMAKQAQEKIIKILATWMEASQIAQKTGIQNPFLWLNVVLTLGEAFLHDNDHPAAALFTEISPMLRKEIRAKLYGETNSTGTGTKGPRVV